MRSADLRASLRRIWIQLTADRKRFGVLCATFGVGLLLWARLIIVSGVSRTAVARPDTATPATSAPSGSPSKAQAGIGAADKQSSQRDRGKSGQARTTTEVRLSSRCERDPFVISPVFFPKVQAATTVKQEAGKLPTEPAEDPSQKHARLVARLRQLVGTVRLDAALGRSMAIIDGRRYQVGQTLSPLGPDRFEFTLVEVRQRSVVLECQGERFEVEMSVPGKSGA